MSNETAALVIAVDSSGVKTAVVDMEKLTAASEKLESAQTKGYQATINAQNAYLAESTALAKATQSSAGLSIEVQRLLDRYDPLGTKMRALQSEMALLSKTMGDSNAAVVAKAFQGLEADIEKTANTMRTAGADGFEQMGKSAERGAFATAGARRELLVLGHEAMTGNFSRMPGSFMVLAERMHITSLMFSPMVIGFVAVAAAGVGLGVLVAHAESLARAMNTLEAQMTATGRAGEISVTQFKALIDQMAMMPGVTKDAAEEVVSNLTKTHQIGAPLLQDLALLAADYARATGQDVVAASKAMAKGFADPAQGAKDFEAALGTLNASTMIQIQNMVDANDKMGAQKVLAEALAAAIKGLNNDALTPMQRATQGVAEAWERAMHAMGDSTVLKGVNSALVGIINSMSWVIGHADTFSIAFRGIPVIGTAISSMAALGDATRKMGGATGEWTDANADAAKKLSDMTKGALALGSGYVSAAGKADQYATTTKVLTDAINANVAAGQGDTLATKKLRDELAGVNEAQQGRSKAVKDNSTKILANALLEEQTTLDREKNLYEERIKMLGTFHSKLGLSDADFYAGKIVAQDQYVAAEAATYAREVALVQDSPGKDQAAVAARQAQLNSLFRVHQNFIDKLAKAQADAGVEEVVEQKKRYDEIAKAIDKAGNSEIQSLESTLTKLREKNVETGKTKEQIDVLRSAQEDAGTADLQLQADAYSALLKRSDITTILTDQDKVLYEQQFTYLTREISLRKDIAEQFKKNAVAEAAADQDRKQVQLLESVDKAAESAFVNIAENGSNAFTKIGKTLKTAVLDLLYQMTIKKWIIGITGSLTGASESAMAQATGAGGGLSGLTGMASTASNLYSSASSLVTVGSQVFAGTMSVANALGTVAANATGTGITGLLATNGAYGTAAAGTAAGVGGSITAGLAAIGPVGWAAIATVAAFAIFGGKKGIASESTGSMTRTYDGDGNVTASNSHAAPGNGGSVVDSIYAGFRSVQQSLGGKGGATFDYGSFSGNDNKNPMFSLNGAGFNSGHIALTDENSKLAVSRAIFGALQASDLPVSIAKFFKDKVAANLSGADIQGITTAALAFSNGIKQLNVEFTRLPFAQLHGLTFDATAALTEFAGGIGKLGANLTSYYDNFYSEGERSAQATKNLTADLKTLGIDALPATREAYRAQVEALDLTTESGQKTYAGMLALSGTFAQLVPATALVTTALSDVVPATELVTKTLSDVVPAGALAARSIKDIADGMKRFTADIASLEIELARKLGDTKGADAYQYKIDTQGLSAGELALFNYSAALRTQIAAVDAATAATAAAAQVEQAVAGERKTLQTQLYGLTDTAAQALERQRSGLNESNRALFDQIQALIAQKTATQAAAVAATEAAQAATQAAAAQKAAAVAAMQSATAAVNNAFSQVNTAANNQKTSLSATYQSLTNDINAQLSTVGASVSKLQSLSNTLKSTLSGMQILGGQGAARISAQQTISELLATAKSGGGLPVDPQALNAALSTVSKPSEQLFSNFTDYAKDFYKTANDIAALSDLTDKGVTDQQAIEATLKAQLVISKASYDSQIAQITAMQDQAKAQLDALTGNGTTSTTLVDAMTLFSKTLADAVALSALQIVGAIVVLPPQIASAVSGVAVLSKADRESVISQAATTAATKGTTTDMELYNKAQSVHYSASDVDKALGFAPGTAAGYVKTNNLAPLSPTSAVTTPAYVSAVAVLSAADRDDVMSRAGQAAIKNGTTSDMELYNIAKSVGYKAPDVDKALGFAPGTAQNYITGAGLPQLAIGTNYVPKDMFAKIHEGEAVVPKAFNPAANGGSNSDLAAELRAMRKEFKDGLAAMQTSQERGNEYAKTSSDRLSGRQGVPMLVQVVSKTGALA